mgnify:CR=1 FL=1
MNYKEHHSQLDNPGDWCYVSNSQEETSGMVIRCPGCGAKSWLQFEGTSTTVSQGAKWKWDGNREHPTLKPSVHSTGCCGWHGWLTNGEWKEC